MTRFIQIDRIDELLVGETITATKTLSLAESYLQDHFPRFPVMPGVMMLEAMFQAAAWLVRVSEDFAHSMVLLDEAKNVKFAELVQPGDCLTVTCQWGSETPQTVTLKCEGRIGERTAVKARLVLRRFNLRDEDPAQEPLDWHVIERFRQRLRLIDRSSARLIAAAGLDQARGE